MLTTPQDPFLFSIVTVCYNAKETIQSTIDSVASQQGVSFEHIIIDGGSNDGTMDIINSQRDKFSYIVSEADAGVYDAMQKGLMQAKGRFTGFLNADDYFESSNALKVLSSPLSDTKANIIGLTGAIEQIDETGKTTRLIGRNTFANTHIKWGKFPPHPATYFETDLMKAMGGFDNSFKIVGDFDMFLRIIKHIDKHPTATLAHVPDTVVKMRLGGLSTGGISTYFKIGAEMSRALKMNDRPGNSMFLHLRGLRKLPELINPANK